MAVILLSLPRPGDWSELPAPREDSRGASRCPGETQGRADSLLCAEQSVALDVARPMGRARRD